MTAERYIEPVLDLDVLGPQVGAPFPDVRLPAHDGRLIDLHGERAGRRAIVVLHRSAVW